MIEALHLPKRDIKKPCVYKYGHLFTFRFINWKYFNITRQRKMLKMNGVESKIMMLQKNVIIAR